MLHSLYRFKQARNLAFIGFLIVGAVFGTPAIGMADVNGNSDARPLIEPANCESSRAVFRAHVLQAGAYSLKGVNPDGTIYNLGSGYSWRAEAGDNVEIWGPVQSFGNKITLQVFRAGFDDGAQLEAVTSVTTSYRRC